MNSWPYQVLDETRQKKFGDFSLVISSHKLDGPLILAGGCKFRSLGY